MKRKELSKEQRIEAHELHDEDPDGFDIWLLNYMDIITDKSVMIYQDFIFEYYIEMRRLNKIDKLLGEL